MLGKYMIADRLGAGGFGTGYLAEDTKLDRKVALKIPHHQEDEVRLLHEPKIMVALKHPNIVELITVEKEDGTFFMVMEYVEGIGLDKQIRQERSLKPQRALDIAIGICSAVAFAHSLPHQIIHRDLRPANILMTKDGIPKVTDFGTSRMLDQQKDAYARTRIGSPPYMAPEHFRGRTVFQSDIWSLGITIYEMLTGVVPFYDADPVKIAQAFATQPIVPPHLRNPLVPKGFSEAVMKALLINLGERYISAQEFLKALQGLKAMAAQPPAVPAAPPMPQPTSNQGGKQSLCTHCYRPLPRMATKCPACGEKV
jgi:serine/threonine-protein kinase